MLFSCTLNSGGGERLPLISEWVWEGQQGYGKYIQLIMGNCLVFNVVFLQSESWL